MTQRAPQIIHVVRRVTFLFRYEHELAEELAAAPGDYIFGPGKIPWVAEHMVAGFCDGTSKMEGVACHATLMALGIRNEYKALTNYLEGGEEYR